MASERLFASGSADAWVTAWRTHFSKMLEEKADFRLGEQLLGLILAAGIRRGGGCPSCVKDAVFRRDPRNDRIVRAGGNAQRRAHSTSQREEEKPGSDL